MSSAEASESRQFPCAQCGAELTFAPGQNALKCTYCGHLNPIEREPLVVTERDYKDVLQARKQVSDQVYDRVVKCQSCAAEFEVAGHQTSSRCAYCDMPIVVEPTNKHLIKPGYVLPFQVDVKHAKGAFKTWLKSRWFAPNAFQKQARQDTKLKGLYVPYWTYDSDTVSDYTGFRGEYYYETQTYTTVENGRTVVKTRMVRKIRWYPASGAVRCNFDDILVLASNNLPRKYADALEPWELGLLTDYKDDYLSGFGCEIYQIDLESGFEVASQIMDGHIRQAVKRDIGGDQQQITSLRTTYRKITFKHVLLPIWISAYRFRSKIFTFLVNGQTGEVQGERPYSWVKITLASLLAAGVIGAIVWAFNH